MAPGTQLQEQRTAASEHLRPITSGALECLPCPPSTIRQQHDYTPLFNLLPECNQQELLTMQCDHVSRMHPQSMLADAASAPAEAGIN
eukprot:1146259-Pelagomonas_calceolata.AAC.2